MTHDIDTLRKAVQFASQSESDAYMGNTSQATFREVNRAYEVVRREYERALAAWYAQGN
jgi:curved DNA-binding protein CbpA